MLQLKKLLCGIAMIAFCITSFYVYLKFNKNEQLIIDSEYGQFVITEPVLIDLIKDPYMQRLKGVRQYGPRYYITKKEEYHRYEHSVGVFLLLRKYGAPLNEQIAGLLHDVSHTVFSHVGDFLFANHECYQDDIQEEFIKNTSLSKILKKYDIKISDILDKNELLTALEKPLPDLCADRLEYNLKGGIVADYSLKKTLTNILQDLIFENDQWIFTSIKSAKKFAVVPLNLTQNVWGSADGVITYEWMAHALQRAVEIHLITLDEVKYSTDEVVWQKLMNSDDAELKIIMDKLNNYKKHFMISEHDYDRLAKAKFRGINPLVKTDDQIKRLTELDQDFNKEFNAVKMTMQKGWPVKFLSTSIA